MNQTMIDNINSTVPPDAVLYHLGDFGFAPAEKLQSIIDQIHCKIIFLDGNHDKEMKHSSVRSKLSDLSPKIHRGSPVDGITQVTVPGLELKVKDPDAERGEQQIYLCHYPSITWNKAHHGSWMAHGHCHGSLKYPFPARIMDVGVDPNNYYPVSYDEMKHHMKKIKAESLDHHKGD